MAQDRREPSAVHVVGIMNWDGLLRPQIYYAMVAIFSGLFLSVIDGTICKNEYSLTCRKTVKDFEEYTPDAVISSEWIFKALDLQADIALFLQINSRGRLCLCADASKVTLIELKTIEPAVVVTVDNMRVEPMSFIKITQDNNRSLNPTKL